MVGPLDEARDLWGIAKHAGDAVISSDVFLLGDNASSGGKGAVKHIKGLLLS